MAKRRHSPERAPRRLRIVGGNWKRTALPVPALPGLRPTPDRVRETLFNWLGQGLEGLRVLDLFAGTGALGLEAASRGAARVLMIEREPQAARAIGETIARLGAGGRVELVCADAFVELRRRADGTERFDLVFVDPPFGQAMTGRALAAATPVLAPGARVYVETGAALAPQPGFHVVRAGRAGQVHYHLLVQDEHDSPPQGAFVRPGVGPTHGGDASRTGGRA